MQKRSGAVVYSPSDLNVLPNGARVGSVDRFQGQEAPVCILSLCSSYGEYGARGLGFILDRNRINVAISHAQCLAIILELLKKQARERDAVPAHMRRRFLSQNLLSTRFFSEY
jgi:superfamily I DNA and/or RNA helicase